MQTSFLDLYSSLIRPDTNNSNQVNSSGNVTGLWLAHGDEPLVQQWLVDAIRGIWQQANLAIKRVELVSAKSWQEVISELNSLSLFDDATAVIVTGNHKPDKQMQTQLEAFATDASAGNNQNAVLWLTSKVDKRARSSKWFIPFAKFGTVVDCNLYNENQRQQLLSTHAQNFGLELSREAWQILMVQTEHHLLSAYQALWRLSYLLTPAIVDANTDTQATDSKTPNNASQAASSPVLDTFLVNHPITSIHIDVTTLQDALVNESHYSVFDLSDTMLAGDATKVVKIIEQLRTTGEPAPLLLWAIEKDMRLIRQLLDGQDPQSLGIWLSKQGLYRQACQRQNFNSVQEWSDLLYRCDKAIKGVLNQSPWELILQAALQIAGVQLFVSSPA